MAKVTAQVRRIRPRQEYRQHSKSTLLRATETLFRERTEIVAREGSKWRRRLVWVAVAVYLAGVGSGVTLAILLRY